MFPFFRYFACFLFFSISLQAQTPQTIPFEAQITGMGYDESNSLLDVYLSFEGKKLPFQKNAEGQWQALIPFTANLVKKDINGAEESVWADAARLSFISSDSLQIQEQSFVHVLRTAVAPGEYTLQLSTLAQPQLGLLAQRADHRIKLEDFNDGKVKFGDVLLSTNMTRSEDVTNPFYRNGVILDVNPSLLFGRLASRVFYYIELYNTKTISETGKYTSYTYISEANIPQPFGSLENRIEKTAKGTDIIAGNFDISTLPSQSYFFKTVVLDENNAVIAEQTKKFFVYNPGVVVATPEVNPEEAFLASGYATMPEEEIKDAIQQITPLLTTSEVVRLRQLSSLENKRQFLFEAWQTRDPNKSTVINEFKLEFSNRIQYANERYGTRFRPGWKTEQGTVLLKYGRPDEVQMGNMGQNTVPHEIWKYNNIQGIGRAEFIFADISETGFKELIHSSVQGERYDPNWQSKIQKM